MTLLTVTEYLCLKWLRICSTCRKHYQILFSFMTYHQVWNYNNTSGVTSGVGTAFPSGAPEFTPVLSLVRVAQSLIVCVMFCRSLFVLLLFFFWPLCCLSAIYGFWLPFWCLKLFLWKERLNSDGQQFPPISTKRTIAFLLKSWKTTNARTYDVVNPGPGLGQTHWCCRFNLRILDF